MSRRLASLFLLAALCSSTAPVFAQSQPDVLDHFSLMLGGFFASASTSLKVDGEIPGSEVDLEETLGLGNSQDIGRMTFDWSFARKHTLHVAYYTIDRSQSTRIDTEIIVDDVVFPVDTTVRTNFGIDFWDVAYTFWPYRSDTLALGIRGGLVGMSLSFSLENIPESGDQGFDLEARASTDLPVPGIGGSYRQRFGESFLLEGKLTFLPTVSIDRYRGDSLNASIAGEYRFLDHYAIGASYNYFGLRFSVERGSFVGSLSYRIDGGEAYVRFYW